MQLNCWSLRCSWSIACRPCSNYIFILNLTPGFNGLGKDNYKMRREAFKFWDLVCLILEILRLDVCHVIAPIFCVFVPCVPSCLVVFCPAVATVITKAPEDVSYTVGTEEVHFDCKATSDDSTPVLITWEKDDARIYMEMDPRVTITATQLIINLKNLSSEDVKKYYGGEYMCVAENGYSLAQAKATLYMSGEGPVGEGHNTYDFYTPAPSVYLSVDKVVGANRKKYRVDGFVIWHTHPYIASLLTPSWLSNFTTSGGPNCL